MSGRPDRKRSNARTCSSVGCGIPPPRNGLTEFKYRIPERAVERLAPVTHGPATPFAAEQPLVAVSDTFPSEYLPPPDGTFSMG